MDGVHYTCGVVEPPTVPGGVGAEKPTNREIQALVDRVKAEFLAKSGINAVKFLVVSYKEQTVAGRIYFVKVNLGGGRFAHLRIYEPLPHTGQKPRLERFLLEKKKEDPINHF